MILDMDITEQFQGLNLSMTWVVSAHEDGSTTNHESQKLAAVRIGKHNTVMEMFHQITILWIGNIVSLQVDTDQLHLYLHGRRTRNL